MKRLKKTTKQNRPPAVTVQRQAVVLQRLVSLRERLWARSENAYCDMIGIARKDESLGWEIKVERGEFGRKELDAHTAGGEKLGRHRALAEACREIDELLKQANRVISPNPEAKDKS